MTGLLGAILLASLVGSLHCAGMCGAFVTLACGFDRANKAQHARLQACYHGGRLVGYTTLGLIAGTIGHAIDLGASAAGLGRVASLLAATTILLVAVGVVLRTLGVRLPHAPVPKPLKSAFGAGVKRFSAARPTARALAIGSLTALLPCGWLYAFALVAAGTGSPAWGAAVMAAFWVGTVPILASVGLGAATLNRRFGPRLRAAATVCVALIAGVILFRTGAADLSVVRDALHAEHGAVEPTPASLTTEAPCPLCEPNQSAGAGR